MSKDQLAPLKKIPRSRSPRFAEGYRIDPDINGIDLFLPKGVYLTLTSYGFELRFNSDVKLDPTEDLKIVKHTLDVRDSFTVASWKKHPQFLSIFKALKRSYIHPEEFDNWIRTQLRVIPGLDIDPYLKEGILKALQNHPPTLLWKLEKKLGKFLGLENIPKESLQTLYSGILQKSVELKLPIAETLQAGLMRAPPEELVKILVYVEELLSKSS